MIIFDLQCAGDHRFEGWFDSSEDFERQSTQGQVVCPYCGDTHIRRMPSAVAIQKQASQSLDLESIQQSWLTLCRHVRDTFEDVGHNFANEALKVHYGLVEERNIRGVSTEAEEEMLKEEGVSFVKIPMPQQLDS